MKTRLFIMLYCLATLTGCVSVCGRSGPNDCRGQIDCWYTQKAFQHCHVMRDCNYSFYTCQGRPASSCSRLSVTSR